MNNAEIWQGLTKVAAPDGFEDGVLRELDRRRRTVPRARRTRAFKWALSGSAAAVLIGFTALNLFVFKSDRLSLSESVSAAAGETIHITESVNYNPEAMAAASEPGTIFLLEQVSDASPSMIRY